MPVVAFEVRLHAPSLVELKCVVDIRHSPWRQRYTHFSLDQLAKVEHNLQYAGDQQPETTQVIKGGHEWGSPMPCLVSSSVLCVAVN